MISKSALSLNIDIDIFGEVYIPPCVVNEGAAIDVDFGRIPVKKVNGLDFAVSKTIPVKCDYYKGTPYVKIIGRKFLAMDNVLMVDSSEKNSKNLGISLFQGDGRGERLIIGDGNGYGYKLNHGFISEGGIGHFTFTAIPYKTPGEILEEGEFSSTAKIEIIYL